MISHASGAKAQRRKMIKACLEYLFFVVTNLVYFRIAGHYNESEMTVFLEIATIFTVATIFAVLAKLLKQPFVVAYIVAGIAVGPLGLDILHSTEIVELLSKIGIVSLLFIVGISLNPQVISEIGKTAIVTGVGQVAFTAIGGFLIAKGFGIETLPSIYIAIALTFSSTIIIMKLLSDKGDLETLYGKISIGFLLVQDIIATIALIAVTTLTASVGNGNPADAFFALFVKTIAVSFLLFLLSKYLLPSLSKFLAGSGELLFLFSVTWGIGLSGAFSLLGLSAEVGALVSGITLSVSPFAYEITSRMKPLRDFFIVLFFILLGSQMAFNNFDSLIAPIFVFSIFVLIGNPLILFVIMNLLGYRRKTAFQIGLTVAQISEFSLILVALGLSVGHVNSDILSIVTFVGLITISVSTYLIIYNDAIYSKISKYLSFFEIVKKPHLEKSNFGEANFEVVLFGFDRVGARFLEEFKKLDKNFAVIDINPKSIVRAKRLGANAIYGDASDIEFLAEIPFKEARLIVSTIPDFETNDTLTRFMRKKFKDSIIIVLAHTVEHAKQLYRAGATYVVLPHHLGAEHAATMISDLGLSLAKFTKKGQLHRSGLDQ